MSDTFYIVPAEQHDTLVEAAYRHRGYTVQEAKDAARFCRTAATHGVRTHNAIKALHLDELFGSRVGSWVPGAEIEEIATSYKAAKVWDGKRKLGPSIAYRAMEACMAMADEYGVGVVSVDNATHYLWGGGYVIEAAQQGYIAYTNCTSATSEVVPFGGKTATMGTNPHSWAFPTTAAVGFPIVVDWATSAVAMGRVQQFQREGRQLPPGSAVDADGSPTTDPNQAVALLPFGAHKGYGLGLIDELYAAFTGGSLPTIRGVADAGGPDEKRTSTFFFQVLKPEALSSGRFAAGRSRDDNVRQIIEDVLGHGNEQCLLPGQIEAEWAARVRKAGGLLFSEAEIDAINEIADECGAKRWSISDFASES